MPIKLDREGEEVMEDLTTTARDSFMSITTKLLLTLQCPLHHLYLGRGPIREQDSSSQHG